MKFGVPLNLKLYLIVNLTGRYLTASILQNPVWDGLQLYMDNQNE